MLCDGDTDCFWGSFLECEKIIHANVDLHYTTSAYLIYSNFIKHTHRHTEGVVVFADGWTDGWTLPILLSPCFAKATWLIIMGGINCIQDAERYEKKTLNL